MPLNLRTLLLIGLLLVGLSGFGQQKQIDSLRLLLGSHPAKDTVHLRLLTELADTYAEDKHDIGISLADTAIKLAMQLHQQRALAQAYYAKGDNLLYNDLGGARQVETTAVALFSRLNDKQGLVLCYNKLSRIEYGNADYLKGLDFAKKAAVLAEELGNRRQLAAAYNNQGTNYTYLSDHTQAMQYTFKALSIYESMGDRYYIARMFINIGLIYLYEKRYPEALDYCNKSLVLLEGLNKRAVMAVVLNNIGDLYNQTHQYKKCIEFDSKALIINIDLGIKKGIGNNLADIGDAYMKLQQYSVAYRYIKKAIKIYADFGAKYNLADAMGSLVLLYRDAPDSSLLKIGIDPAKRLILAASLEEQAVNIAHNVKNTLTESELLNVLGGLYERQGNYSRALKTYHSYEKLKDSLFNDKKRQETDRLLIKYNSDKQEVKTQAEMERQTVVRNAIIIISSIILVAILAVLIFYRRRNAARIRQKDAEFKARVAEFKVSVAELELKALRSQLNPHFIFNSLNSIGDFIGKHDQQTADDYLAKFGQLMRMTLENSEKENISLADDLNILELYLKLEQLRLGNRFNYQINIDPAIDPENTLIPPMMLQPFVENSIWHGIRPKTGNGTVAISVKKHQGMIEYIVEDDGVGRKNRQTDQVLNNGHKKSYGIKVNRERIDRLNESRQTHATIELTDLPQGTRVNIFLPLELMF